MAFVNKSMTLAFNISYMIMALGRHLTSVLREIMEVTVYLLRVFHINPWALQFSATALSPTYQS